MSFGITYEAEYRYDSPVHEQHNALRVKPATTPTQRVASHAIEVAPLTRLHHYADYFGTEVVQFAIAAPHERLLVRAQARVATEVPPAPPDPGWETLGDPDYRAGATEYLVRVPSATDPLIDELAAACRSDSPLATLHAVCELIPGRFEYRAGVTYVGSTVADLIEAEAGVCQDFAHLGLELLRRNGIAARYVSGYLFVPDGDGERSAEVDTHAWLEAMLPGPDGTEQWVGADPTNRSLASPGHVKIGHGRHYADVPPIKGVYRGAADSEHEVTVTMVRLDGAGDGPT